MAVSQILLRWLNGGILVLLAGCLQVDFGAPQKSSNASFTQADIEAFHKQYPDLQQRSREAFKLTVHPLLRRSCGGCHAADGNGPIEARAIPHSDQNSGIAYSISADRGLFDLRTAENSRVFHMDYHPVPFSTLLDSPEGASAPIWLTKIRSYAALRGEVGTTDPVQVSCSVYNQFVSSGGTPVDLPGTAGSISVAGLVENGGSRPNVTLNLQFKIGFSNPPTHYTVSDIRFVSNAPANHLLRIEKIELGLGHSSVASSVLINGPFEVIFNGNGSPIPLSPASQAVQLPAQIDLTSTCASSSSSNAHFDGITFEFRGLSWGEAPAPSPSPSTSPSPALTDYPSLRRAAAMSVLVQKCSGCHGLGGASGGVFPKAAEMMSGNFQAITDADWSAYWVVSGNPGGSRLMTRLQAVANGGPQLSGTNRTMPLGRPAPSLQEVYALNDWILLMGADGAKTFRFEIPTGNSQSSLGDWNSPSQPIQLKVGDKLFVRNLDSVAHAIHTNANRPFPHQTGSTIACSATTPCGSSVFTAINPANSVPMQGSDSIYDHLFRGNGGRQFNIYMVVTP